MITDPMLIPVPTKGSRWIELQTGVIFVFDSRVAAEADGETFHKGDVGFVLNEENTESYSIWLAEHFYSLFRVLH